MIFMLLDPAAKKWAKSAGFFVSVRIYVYAVGLVSIIEKRDPRKRKQPDKRRQKMCVKKIGLLALATLLIVGMAAQPALAEKGGNGKKGGREYAQERAADKHGGDDGEVFGFSDKEADIVIGLLKHLYGGGDEEVEIVRPSRSFCPPGLAKKNNGCMPPGQAKKYSIGHPLGDDVVFNDLPSELRDALGIPPKGKKYVQVDRDVLLITEVGKVVLDAIGLGNR